MGAAVMRNEREAHMTLSNTAAEVAKARKVLAAKRKARAPKSMYADGILSMLAKVLKRN